MEHIQHVWNHQPVLIWIMIASNKLGTIPYSTKQILSSAPSSLNTLHFWVKLRTPFPHSAREHLLKFCSSSGAQSNASKDTVPHFHHFSTSHRWWLRRRNQKGKSPVLIGQSSYIIYKCHMFHSYSHSFTICWWQNMVKPSIFPRSPHETMVFARPCVCSRQWETPSPEPVGWLLTMETSSRPWSTPVTPRFGITYIYIYVIICMVWIFTILRFGVFYNLVNLVDVIKGCSATVFEGFAQQKWNYVWYFFHRLVVHSWLQYNVFFHQPMATNQKKKEIMQNNLENVGNSRH